ncbi:MAG TPA: hypothetical protein VIK18_20615, partial [Pirellulales bacterium]
TIALGLLACLTALAQGRGPASDATSPPAPFVPAAATVAADAPVDITVYVTRTGAKYHLQACRHLRSSSIPIKLSEARQQYAPCRTCHPPQ